MDKNRKYFVPDGPLIFPKAQEINEQQLTVLSQVPQPVHLIQNVEQHTAALVTAVEQKIMEQNPASNAIHCTELATNSAMEVAPRNVVKLDIDSIEIGEIRNTVFGDTVAVEMEDFDFLTPEFGQVAVVKASEEYFKYPTGLKHAIRIVDEHCRGNLNDKEYNQRSRALNWKPFIDRCKWLNARTNEWKSAQNYKKDQHVSDIKHYEIIGWDERFGTIKYSVRSGIWLNKCPVIDCNAKIAYVKMGTCTNHAVVQNHAFLIFGNENVTPIPILCTKMQRPFNLSDLSDLELLAQDTNLHRHNEFNLRQNDKPLVVYSRHQVDTSLSNPNKDDNLKRLNSLYCAMQVSGLILYILIIKYKFLTSLLIYLILT